MSYRYIVESKEGARAEPPVALLRMDTLTSGSTEVESNSEEDSSRGHLDGPTLSILCHGDEEKVVEWLDSLGHSKTEAKDYDANEMIIINQALHEVVQRNKLNIAILLLDYGADVTIRDGERRTLLHVACDCPQEEDTQDMVKMLLQRGCPVNAEDEDNNTPLHYAAENGHTMSVRVLLGAGAKLDAKNDLDDTPVHAAAENGHLEVIDEMIDHISGCVHYRGFQQETPLHDACSSGYVKVARRLLEMGADVGAISEVGETPLHKAAETSSVAVVKLLLDEGAEINPKTDAKRTPLAKACYFGHTEVVHFLLERGADVKPKALEDAIKEGYELIAHALLQSPQWPKAMRNTFRHEGRLTTPFRQLIRKMPAVAKDILDKCTVSPPNCPDPGDIHYSVLFNYEFVEDFQDENHDSDDEKQPKRKKKFDEKQRYGCGYMEVRQAKREYFTTTWGPLGFSKENHPLQIMVEHKRLNLLKHPLVGSLLHYKWKSFSRLVYFINLFSYALFVLCITTFALVVPNPQSCECGTNTTSGTEQSESDSMSSQTNIYIAASAVIICASFRLLFELIQLCILRLRFILNWGNIMEIILFTFSIIYGWIFNSPCLCPKPWQWQIGAIAVFLAWIDLILFFAKFPQIGIYSLIFVKILSTFCKAVFVSALLVIAFALALYMSFYEPSIMRSPFSTPARSLLKTVSMSTGEQEFDSIFHQEASGGRDELADVPFPPVSSIMWILFVIFIPILLTNMLVGLAVGDIQDIYDEASLKKVSLQVEQVLTFEELFPTKLRRKFVTGYKEVFPNQRPTVMKQVQNLFWDGQPYDTKPSINSALRPPLDAGKDIQRKTDQLVQDVEDIKHSLTHLQGHSKQTRQDLNHVTEEVGVMTGSIQHSSYKYGNLFSEMETIKQSLERSQVAIFELKKALKQLVNKKLNQDPTSTIH